MSENGSTVSINMGQHFPRLDINTLALSAASSQQNVATAAVSDKALLLTIQGYGTTTITVTATDHTGLAITETFQVTIDRTGDINGDGTVSSSDALFVSKVAKGLIIVSPEELKKYDIDKDGSVTNADVLALMTLIASQKNGSNTPPLTDNNYIISMRNINDAPLGLPKDYSVNEDTELNVTASLAADVIDIENDTLSVSSVTQPVNGALTLKNDGSFTYQPNANFNGVDTFTYKVNDGSKESAPILVTINVAAVNDSPTAQDGTLDVTEDTQKNGQLSGSDIDNTELTYHLVTDGSKGNVTINPTTGEFVYTPHSNATGTDSFTYKISDVTGESNTATIAVSIAAINDAPVAAQDQFTTAEDSSLAITGNTGVLNNDTDVENDALSAMLVSGTNHGSFVLNSDGSFKYEPDSNFYGDDTFTYKANDGTSDSEPVTVTIHVTPVNDAPTALDGTLDVTEDTPKNGQLSGNDIDNTELTYHLVNDGSKGNVTINSITGAFVYTPHSNATGMDSFTFKISDGTGESTTTTVSVTIDAVNDAPAATPDQFTTAEDTTLAITGNTGVLNNDSDVENDALSAMLVSGTNHGSFVLNSDGSFKYEPDSNFYGDDTFTYKVNDGMSDSEPVTVTIHVTPVNDAPTAHDGTLDVTEDTPKNGQLSGSDIDNTELTYQLVNDGSKGNVTINSTTGAFVYTPHSNATGTDSFTFKISDGTGESTTATVSVTIDAVNDAPVAAPDQFTTAEDSSLAITGNTGVLNNDSDVENDPLSAMLVSGTNHGSFVLNSDGSFKYEPDSNFNGDDTFTYKVNDGMSDSEPVTVTIHVTPVNDAPTAHDGTLDVTEDTPKNGQLSGSDIDNTELTYHLVNDGSKGNVTINPKTGTFVYTPHSNATGTDSFTFKISDGTGESTTATVSVMIDAVNDAPAVTNTISDQSMAAGTADLSFDLTNVFADVDGDPLVYSVKTSDPAIAAVSMTGASLKLTPGVIGTATVTITAADGNGGVESTSFKVNVTNPNAAPIVAHSIADISTNAGSAPGTVDLSAVFSDADHDTLTYTAVSSDANIATAAISGNSLAVTPAAAGRATITVSATDSHGASATTTFVVTVTASKNVTLTPSLFDRDALTEANLHAATILLTLDGDNFNQSASEVDFKLNNAPAGLKLGPALIMGNEAYLILDYDGRL
ncbi:Ig-like domain-containing protein [Neobacillus sp. PS3-34]|uniref:tandem-95 repeat protein n=1 Tax=Neobacillus sp. PS3-34 TaxID=3070678 RepID=UPI0027E14944|nr:Ig-like domain-containing protein [Neobacillus sp. PS3-34]WML46818.1 Ig-like domain-containing protein [Neobacillus sp. PS3-34]